MKRALGISLALGVLAACGTSPSGPRGTSTGRAGGTSTGYVGGYFWWYFAEDMVPKTKPLFATLSAALP